MNILSNMVERQGSRIFTLIFFDLSSWATGSVIYYQRERGMEE